MGSFLFCRPKHLSFMPESDVQVYLRVRPSDDAAPGLSPTGPTSVVAGHGKSAQEYTSGLVFGANTAQTAVFDAIGKDMTSACLEGFNTTIFAYGQTGAGKTYTVVGGEDGDTEGLILVFYAIFSQ